MLMRKSEQRFRENSVSGGQQIWGKALTPIQGAMWLQVAQGRKEREMKLAFPKLLGVVSICVLEKLTNKTSGEPDTRNIVFLKCVM